MKYAEVWPRTFQHAVLEDIDIFHAFIFHKVCKAFALHTCHIEYVSFGYHMFVKLRMFLVADTLRAAVSLVFFGHLQLFGSYEVEGRVEMTHSHKQRVYRTSILQVAYKVDVEVLKRTLRLVDGVKVKHSLRRMLVGSIACIDDRYGCNFACIACSTFKIVTHDNNVGIVAHHHDGILQRFTLRRTCHLRVCKPYDTCAKPVCSSFKTQSGTRRRFKKQRSHNPSVKNLAVRIFFKKTSHLEEVHDFLLRMVCNGN